MPAPALRALLGPSLALAALLAVGCSSSDASDGGALDAASGVDALVVTDASPAGQDAEPASRDAAPTDAIAPHDAEPASPDAEPARPDAEPATQDAAPASTDASAPDATPGAPDAGFANACENVGGICVGPATQCTSGGGTVLAAGAPGCIFSDGPGTCCQPPTRAPEGPTCEQHGGLCAPIAGCNFVEGAFAPPSCGYPGVVCCVPQSQCGPETQVCCEPGGQTTFRPACEYGVWECVIPGTQLMPPTACP